MRRSCRWQPPPWPAGSVSARSSAPTSSIAARATCGWPALLEEVPVIQTIVAEQRDLGLDLTYLPDNAAVREIAPAIAETVLAASYCPSDGHANPIATVEAFAMAAARHGATLRTETAVTAIDASGGSIRGVRTTNGDIAADVVVVAAGVYTARLCAPLGLDLPSQVSRVAAVQTVPLPPLIRQVLGTAGADFAGRQEVGGRFRLTGGGKPWPHQLEDFAHGDDAVLPPAAEVIAAFTRGIEVLPRSPMLAWPRSGAGCST